MRKMIKILSIFLMVQGLLLPAVSWGQMYGGTYQSDSSGTYDQFQKINPFSGKDCEVGSANHCAPYCKYKQVRTCFVCPIFAVIFNVVNQVCANAVTAYSNSVARVVVVGFGIWLALQVLLFVSSIEVRDLKDFAQSLVTQGFIVMLVVAILHTGVSGFFNTFVKPVYLTGQEAARIMFTQNLPTRLDGDTDEGIDDETVTYINHGIKGGVDAEIGESIIQTMTVMENYLRKFNALGSAFMCRSFEDGWFIFPKMIYFITGFFMWILTLVLIVALPFLMIDSVFQLGVAFALLPPAVGAYAFKSLRHYTRRVWETFLNSMFSFVFISVVVLLSMGVLRQALVLGMKDISAAESGKVITSITTFSEAPEGYTVAPTYENGAPSNVETTTYDETDTAAFYAMFDKSTYQASVFEGLIKGFSWVSPPFLRLIFVFLLVWSVMSMAKDFAKDMASSISSTAIGSAIGTMAASTAKGAAKKMAKPVASSIGDKLKNSATGFVRGGMGIGQAYRAGKRLVQRSEFKKSQKTMSDKLSYNDTKGYTHEKLSDGNAERISKSRIVGTKTQLLSNGLLRVVSKKETVSRIRTLDIMIERKTITLIEEQKDKEGKVVSHTERSVIKEKITPMNSRVDRLVNNKGEVDTKTYNDILKNLSGEARGEVEAALAKKIMEKRFSKELHSQRLSKEPEVVNQITNEDGSTEITIKEVTDRGEIVYSTLKINKNGFAETTKSVIDKDGKMTIVSTDGIRNKMVETKINDDAAEEIRRNRLIIKNAQEVERLSKEPKENQKIYYSYAKYYQNQIDHGRDPQTIGFDDAGNELGMMTWSEAISYIDEEGKTKAGAFSEYVGKNGNEIGKARIKTRIFT